MLSTSSLARLKTSLAVPQVLTAAEREWLQEEDVAEEPHSPALVRPHNPSEEIRFDWRLRAPSRARGPRDPAVEDPHKRKTSLKRVRPPHMNVGLGAPFYEEIQAYQAHFLPMLDSEQAEDETVLRERLANWSLDRLQEEGYCLTGLSAFWLDANQFGRPVASFDLGPGIALPDHRFDNGTQVLVSRIDPLKEEPLRGSVVSSTQTRLRVSFPELADLTDGPWRLDVGRSNIVFERMRTAISHMNYDPVAQQQSDLLLSPDRQIVLQGTELRDVLLQNFSPSLPTSHPPTPLQAPDDTTYVGYETLDHETSLAGRNDGAFSKDMKIHSWARRYSQVKPVRVEGDPVLNGLNETQTRAVAMMVGQRISLVQGPPGTGKTKTIIEAVKLLKVHFQVVQPILVCTYTNVAVDNLVEGLAAAGVRPLRVGYGGKVKESLFEHTLDAKLEAHPLKPQVDQLDIDFERVQKRFTEAKQRLQASESTLHSKRYLTLQTAVASYEKQLKVVSAKTYALRQEMLRDIVTAADVSQHVALIGDHKQLPPIITSRDAQAGGLGISLFERLTEEGKVPSIMLDTQYRMHPAISHFPSNEFYNLSVLDGTYDSDGNIHSRLMPPSSSHLTMDPVTGHRPSVVFLDHPGSETMKDRSRVNWNEAHIVCSVVEDLLLRNDTIQGADIGIIAPYVAQISLLSRLFKKDQKYRSRFKSVLGDLRAAQLANIEIKTVDGFEGREKEVIIFSTVRNNPSGHIGFLADRRRLNVGLTRAKRGLFVVGSISTLKAGKISGSEAQGIVRVGKGAEAWRRYAQFLHQRGLVVELNGERLRQTLYGNVPDPGRASYY
ncbi:hypothetical protein JAAARDRAFT_135529 [Jaapia argillacea MUCL 33604]|uniref:AAA+ ATPase domain-containing protein n=1 Tax=Jaapia argillacea MUCL 33604 TaxID=933084 RepID=A0A067PT76_9AGAM|nr:hypothetical protein JAAARDRAFT_135529 [Jaapia argillacea MUCL 33604]